MATEKVILSNPVEDFYNEKGKKAETTGVEQVFNLGEVIKGRITKDYGLLKAGHEQDFSVIAYGVYEKLGIIEKV